jgi:hypothetical protein
VKVGLQTATQQAIKEATKTAEQTRVRVQTQEQVREREIERVRAREQAQEKATAAETEAENIKEAVKEREAELTQELTQQAVKPPWPPDQTSPNPKRIPKGATGVFTWKQGNRWVARWYPYEQQDSIWLKHKPLGAIQIPNANSAYDTIQTLTGMPPDKVPNFRMGFEDVSVRTPPDEPIIQDRAAISFQRNALANRRISKPKNQVVDLGMGIVESRTKNGRRRHLKLI